MQGLAHLAHRAPGSAAPAAVPERARPFPQPMVMGPHGEWVAANAPTDWGESIIAHYKKEAEEGRGGFFFAAKQPAGGGPSSSAAADPQQDVWADDEGLR